MVACVHPRPLRECAPRLPVKRTRLGEQMTATADTGMSGCFSADDAVGDGEGVAGAGSPASSLLSPTTTFGLGVGQRTDVVPPRRSIGGTELPLFREDEWVLARRYGTSAAGNVTAAVDIAKVLS